MLMIRLDMVCRSYSHLRYSSRLFKIRLTIQALYTGGVEISDRCRIASCNAIREIVDEASGPGEVIKWKQLVRSL